MKFVAIDIETTGLSPQHNSVIEFGAVFADLYNTFKPLVFHRYVLPDKMRWDLYCLSLHRDLIIEIANRRGEDDPTVLPSLHFVGLEFRQWLIKTCDWPMKTITKPEKITAAGKNFGSFDFQFLKEAESFNDIFRHRSLDPTLLYVKDGDEFPPELKECKKRAGLGDSVDHRSVADAFDIVHLLQEKFKK